VLDTKRALAAALVKRVFLGHRGRLFVSILIELYSFFGFHFVQDCVEGGGSGQSSTVIHSHSQADSWS
jgi:hypothetical protein